MGLLFAAVPPAPGKCHYEIRRTSDEHGLPQTQDMSADQLSTKRPSPIGGASLGGVANPVQSATLTIVRGGGAGGSGGPQRVVWDPSTAVTTPQNTAPSATPAPMPNAPWWVTESGR